MFDCGASGCSVSLTIVGYLVFLWMLFAATTAYFLCRDRMKSVASTVWINFFLGWLPPISLISLIILYIKYRRFKAETAVH